MKILIWLVYIISIMSFVVGSVYLSRKLMSKFKFNRWIIAAVAPLILIVPSIFFNNIHPIIWAVLIGIFLVLCILFFEINTNISETRGIKTTMDYRKTR